MTRSATLLPRDRSRLVLLHYHELALKGKNRPLFVRQLAQNLEGATADLGGRVHRTPGRLLLRLGADIPWEAISDRVRRVFGVVNFSLARQTAPNLEALYPPLEEALAGDSFGSFRIVTKRGFKQYPLTSVEINRAVGAHVQALTGASVDLENPERTIFIEVTPTAFFFYFDKEQGPGGLPVGVSGRVVTLLSGGIDSPVAAWRMMRRGCRVTFVHFHSYPFLSSTSQEKARELVRLLTQWQLYSRLYLVPFGEIQREVVLRAPPPYRVVIYRRLMAQIAQAIAREEGAGALVTGESLGQVASQTMENMARVDDVVGMPLFRPLVGMDKVEITAQAEGLGTFPISITEDQDCCQLFIPRNPVTKARPQDVERAESHLDVKGLVQQGRRRATFEEFVFPGSPPATA